MHQTLENLDELRLGSVLAEDILVNTKNPIIRKDTKITREHIQVLRAFNVNKVPIVIENVFSRTEEEINKLNEEQVNIIKVKMNRLSKQILQSYIIMAVISFHKEFSSWEAGMKVDVAKLRNIIMPLVEKAMADKQIFSHLNSFSSLDNYVAHHSIAVGIISGAIAKKLHYPSGND